MPKFILMGGQEKLVAKFLLVSGNAAMHFSDILNKHRCRKLETGVCQSLLDAYLRFLSFLERAGCTGTPKCHMNIHMCQRAVFQGNPKSYSTFENEDLNGIVAKVAASCHRASWQVMVHFKLNILTTLEEPVTANDDC
jgi:hypothetical protein